MADDPRVEAALASELDRMTAPRSGPTEEMAAAIRAVITRILAVADANDPLRAPGMLHIRDDETLRELVRHRLYGLTCLSASGAKQAADRVRAALRELAVSDGD